MNARTEIDLPGSFPHTRWSIVLEATRDSSRTSAEALERFCRAYWYPLYAYARRCGESPHNAQDLAQGFFCRLLEKGWLADANRDRGRLRTFLIVALKNYMANERRRAATQRRGGRRAQVPLDTELAERRYAADPESRVAADQLFDRQWALTLLDLTLERLRAEFAEGGRSDDFDTLKDCLMAARGSIDYAAIATRLGSSEGAARVAVHRLRKRFRAIYREEIRQTMGDGEDLDDELQHLAAALALP